MPSYEFKCKACGVEFSMLLKVRELEQQAMNCPACGQSDVQQLPTPFMSKTSRKS